MKHFVTLTLAAAAMSTALVAQDLPRPSQKSTVTQRVGLTDVTITYSRPGVKGRAIWGGLVPYDQVWRTGANEATSFQISDDVTINGQKLAAGTYSLHTIPTKGDWTIIFNSVADQWGSYSYDAAKDSLRIKVTPRTGPATEWLTFSFPKIANDSAEVVIAWDKVEVPFTIKTDTNTKALANVRAAIAAAKPDDFRPYTRGVDYALTNNVAMDDAAQWADKALTVQENHATLAAKARLLAAKGDVAGAIAAGEKAIAAGKKATPAVDTAATEKLVADWKAKK